MMSRILVGVGLVFAACSPRPVATRDVALLYTSSTAAEVYREKAAGVFEHWLPVALHRPGARFEVRVATDVRSEGTVAFSTMVPPRWGADALAQKAAFIAATRRAFHDAIVAGFPGREAPVPDDTAHPVDVIVVPAQGSMAPDAPAGVRHEAVVCDLSDSGDGLACSRQVLAASFDRWLRLGGMRSGSTFSVVIAGTDTATARCPFRVSTPGGSVSRLAFLYGARNELQRVIEPPPRTVGSAIAGGIVVASQLLHQRQGTYALSVCSDLREVSPGLNFERDPMSPEQFVRALRSARLLANLRAVDVVVCGAHYQDDAAGGHLTPRTIAAIRDAWSAAFRAMGSPTPRFHVRCDETVFNE